MDEEVKKAFLAELTQLSLKYKVEIGGCGCCSSPSLWAEDFKPGHYVIGQRGDEDGNLSWKEEGES